MHRTSVHTWWLLCFDPIGVCLQLLLLVAVAVSRDAFAPTVIGSLDFIITPNIFIRTEEAAP